MCMVREWLAFDRKVVCIYFIKSLWFYFILGNQGIRYDSTVNLKSNPTLFVVYDRACGYPEYLIKYRRNYVNLPNGNLPSASKI